jgi:hypothetical protein
MQWNVGINAAEWSEAMDLIIRLLPILIPLFVVQIILAVTAVVNLIRKRNPMNEKVLWLLLILLVNLIGPVIYFAVGANYLDNLHAQREDAEQ